MYKVMVSLTLWPEGQHDCVTIKLLAEALEDEYDAAFKLGEKLCEMYKDEMWEEPEHNIYVTFDIV